MGKWAPGKEEGVQSGGQKLDPVFPINASFLGCALRKFDVEIDVRSNTIKC